MDTGSRNRTLSHLLTLGLIIICCWLCRVLWQNGDYLFIAALLFALISGLVIFHHPRTEAWRYLYPFLLAMVVFLIFPLMLTFRYAFANYGNEHLLTEQRAFHYLRSQYSVDPRHRYTLQLEGSATSLRLVLLSSDQPVLASGLLRLRTNESGHYSGPLRIRLNATPSEPLQPPLSLRERLRLQPWLKETVLEMPDGTLLTQLNLREFVSQQSRFRTDMSPPPAAPQTSLLYETATGRWYAANRDTGYFQALDERGNFTDDHLLPGFVTHIGFRNFRLIVGDKDTAKLLPRLAVFNFVCAALTVVLGFAIGLPLAALLCWQRLPLRSLFRSLMLLPMAVPLFVSALILSLLFDPHLGPINHYLGKIMTHPPIWFEEALPTQAFLIGVSVWITVPYVVLVGMGLMQSVPPELHEAAVMDGAGPIRRFWSITLPHIRQALLPLLLGSFGYNFANYGLVYLLTAGEPLFSDTSSLAGHTDTIMSYAYKLAFREGAAQLSLASAYSVVMLPIMALIIGVQLWWARKRQGGI